jgi:hypothetical protein
LTRVEVDELELDRMLDDDGANGANFSSGCASGTGPPGCFRRTDEVECAPWDTSRSKDTRRGLAGAIDVGEETNRDERRKIFARGFGVARGGGGRGCVVGMDGFQAGMSQRKVITSTLCGYKVNKTSCWR